MSVLAGRLDVAAERYLDVPESDPKAVCEAFRAGEGHEALDATRVQTIVSRAREALA